MKKILTTLSMALVAVAMMAQQPVITFEKTEHDFGKINEADGRVTTIFTFKNEGMEPLVLSNVRASCGCTTPKWPKEPIEPGQTGNITVTYNPSGRPGRFQKTITITSNATEATKRLIIKGEVIPKPANPAQNYSVKMDGLSLKSKAVQFGTIRKGESAKREIEYANFTKENIRVELATSDADICLLSQVTLVELKPNETGKLSFVFDTKACKQYGPQTMYAYVVVNGKRVIADDYKITLSADVTEDFSKLTAEERQQAPIMSIEHTQIDLGKVAAGKKLKGSFNIKNSGTNALLIRRLYCSDSRVVAIAPKSIKAGQKGNVLKVEVNTVQDGKTMEPGKYARVLQVITNDPNQPRKNVTLTWVVE